MSWARVGGGGGPHPLLSVLESRVESPQGEGTAVLARALDGHRGMGVSRPAGPPQTSRLPQEP